MQPDMGVTQKPPTYITPGPIVDQPTEMSNARLTDDTWQAFIEEASKEQDRYIKAWNTEMDTLLLFAALFSAVLTAFVVESYQELQVDTGSETVEVLQQILGTLQSIQGTVGTSGVSTDVSDFQPTSSAVRVNALWFASLVISLSAAFLAILAKQWLLHLDKTFAPTLPMKGRQHQYRYENIEKWKLTPVPSSLPILLHVSLLLFFAGLIECLWSVNVTVAVVSLCFVGITVTIYFAIHILSLVCPPSPYKSSVTSVLLAAFATVLREVVAAVGAPLLVVLLFAAFSLYRGFFYLIAPFVSESWTEDIRTLVEILSSTMKIKNRLTKWRMGIRRSWDRHITSLLIGDVQENRYISRNAGRLDVHILARMIQASSRYPIRRSALAQELARCDALLSYRILLIDSGATSLLMDELHSLYEGNFQQISSQTQDDALRQAEALMKLLTEADESDSHTIIQVQGIPIHIDVRAGSQSYEIHISDDMLRDTEYLPFHAIILRLRYANFSYYQNEVDDAVKAFYDRLESTNDISELTTMHLVNVINTIIYTAKIPVETPFGFDGQQAMKLNARALEVLAAIAVHRPDMDDRVKRQLSYGMWLLSQPKSLASIGLLIPIVSTTATFAKALAELMTPRLRLPSVAFAVLALLEASLYSQSNFSVPSQGDGGDIAELIQVLVQKYPLFVDDLRAGFSHDSKDLPVVIPGLNFEDMVLKLLQRIVRISGYLIFNDCNVPKVDLDCITLVTLELLLCICKHIEDFPSSDRRDILRIAYGSACRIAVPQSMQETRNQSPSWSRPNEPAELPAEKQSIASTASVMRKDNELKGSSSSIRGLYIAHEEYDLTSFPPESLPDAFVSALQATSSLKDPPEALRTILSMITLLSRISGGPRSDDLNFSILAKLRQQSHLIAELTAPLVSNRRFGECARHARDVIQVPAEGPFDLDDKVVY
ncbi:uncharacterized protein LAESUDRAFT_761108 [Laetiporus sulphureus 93-53]|uniref:DUF6535 domain-containing protein n=1 Tax=Laetiporus sulphureus 93-53 TaxID=1314785 RepID=A0A165DCD7_9APHY|nr:uncharacterized protein LAESUDRAFT_761108 [Laetiporus sulphureus 93-53]KZT04552.1 hypothetical protein LAESUDRAFT_761108 [Laetiporus sulphureus 93-53]